LNAPGSWHDARVAQPIYEKLHSRTPDGFYLIADTAFPRGMDQIRGRIRAPMKQGSKLPSDPIEARRVLAFNRQLLSYRQTAEWGNQALQGCFGHLRVPLEITHSSRWGDLLESIMRLHNLWTRLVGINQIRTVYMPIWKADEQEEIWNSFERMLFSEQRKNDRVTCFHMIATEH
jgi:hypothetical protein